MTVRKIHIDRQIYRVVRKIPEGRVATYGQIASLAGLEGQARRVGYALRALCETLPVPWHRVVNSKGQISRRGGADGGAEHTQYLRLRAEGVQFGRNRRIRLAASQWRPGSRI